MCLCIFQPSKYFYFYIIHLSAVVMSVINLVLDNFGFLFGINLVLDNFGFLFMFFITSRTCLINMIYQYTFLHCGLCIA